MTTPLWPSGPGLHYLQAVSTESSQCCPRALDVVAGGQHHWSKARRCAPFDLKQLKRRPRRLIDGVIFSQSACMTGGIPRGRSSGPGGFRASLVGAVPSVIAWPLPALFLSLRHMGNIFPMASQLQFVGRFCSAYLA